MPGGLGEGVSELMWGAATVFVLLIVLLVAVVMARAILRSGFSGRQGAGGDPAFTLSQLRTMLDEGLISQEEFDRMERNLLAGMDLSVDRTADRRKLDRGSDIR